MSDTCVSAMPEKDSGLTLIERILNSVGPFASIAAFLVMVWMAVHIVTDPHGPEEVYRYYNTHLSNFVDPTVKAIVVKTGDGGFMYFYTVSNGPWGFQDIHQFSVETGPVYGEQRVPKWSRSGVRMGIRKFGVMWRTPPGPDSRGGIGRGDTKSGFTVMSYLLPTIVEAHAGNTLHYEGWSGLMSDFSTPAGKRVVQWTLGPRNSFKRAGMYSLLGELVPALYRAAELGWIYDASLAEAIARSVSKAAAAAKKGEDEIAIARLERVLEIVEANAGVQLNEEGYALIAYNVEYVLDALRK